MPRTKARCQSCYKEITDLRKGTAKVFDHSFYNWTKHKWVEVKIYLHQKCYEADNEEAKRNKMLVL